MRKHVYSKKGVGTALGAVFFIGIVLLSLTALITISSYQMKYLQTRDKMIEWDIKRMSENIAIVNLIQPSKKPGYTFDLIVNNTGGVLVKIVRIYIYDNKYNNLSIFDKQKAPGEDGFINGEIMPGEGNHTINIKAQNPLADDSPYRYRIIACTERGRQFSFSYPLPKPLPQEIRIGGYPLIIAASHDNFQYMDTKNASNYFKSAYEKQQSDYNWHPLYRILVNNTTNRKIILMNNCSMLQMGAARGQTQIQRRFIVSNSTDISQRYPIPFSTQIINPYSAQYLYFAGNNPINPDWVGDPQGDPKGEPYVVSFMIWFRYEGESEVRALPLPSLLQILY